MARRSPQRLATLGRTDLDLQIRQIIEEHLRVQAALETLTVRGLLGGNLGTVKIRRQYRREVKRIIEQLGKTLDRPVSRLMKDSYRLGIRIADRGLPEESKPPTLDSIHRSAVLALSENLGGRLGDARSTIGRRQQDLFRREGLKLSAARLATGQDIDIATTRLVRNLVAEGVTSFEDKLGRRWDLDTYAGMVLRTTTSEAIFHGTETQMLARNFDLVTVNQVKDPCVLCQQYDGNTYSLTGRADDYPQLEITFPIHPECRHFVYPAQEAKEEREAHLGRVG